MKIKITAKNYRCFTEKNPLEFEVSIGDTIGFIGVNNAGKSTPHRFIYEFRNLFYELQRPDFYCSFLDKAGGGINLNGVVDSLEIFNFNNNRDVLIKIEIIETKLEIPEQLKMIKLTLNRKSTKSSYVGVKIDQLDPVLNKQKNNYRNQRYDNLNNRFVSLNFAGNQNAFLDTKLTADIFDYLYKSLYIGAFRNTINSGRGSYLDLDIGIGFIENWDQWSEGDNILNQQEIANLVLELENLLGLKNLQITANRGNNGLNINFDGRKYRLDNLGSGIAQIIVVLGNILTSQKRLVLIDEPELNLHPSLQLKFMTLIEKYCEGVIFSTHSMGLARSCANHLYSVKKDDDGSSKIEKWENQTHPLEIIGELSYSSWMDIGVEKILLCEGTSDLKCFKHILKQLKMEHKVLLVPLGGGSLINAKTGEELNELNRLGCPLYCIIDSEKNSEKEEISQERADFVKNCEKAKITIHVLEKRAIENYFTKDALREVFGCELRPLEPFEKLNNHEKAWAKNQDHKIFSKIDWEEIKTFDFFHIFKKLSD